MVKVRKKINANLEVYKAAIAKKKADIKLQVSKAVIISKKIDIIIKYLTICTRPDINVIVTKKKYSSQKIRH